MHNSRFYILLLWTISLSLIVVSCGTKRTVSRSGSLPVTSREISLDDLVGNQGETSIPSEVISTKEAKALVKVAQRWLGTPYKYGGDSRKGVDCSAMVMNVYNEALNIKIPRTTRTQREYASHVKRHDLQPGDLVFFSPGVNGKSISHVGMFIGNDRFIHASSSRGVVVSSLDERYYRDHYHSAGRIVKNPTREIIVAQKETVRRDNSVNQPKKEVETKTKTQSKKAETTSAERQELLDQLLEQQLERLDEILTATIDSIYSMPVDDDPNLAPGL